MHQFVIPTSTAAKLNSLTPRIERHGVACDRHATCARYAAVENRDALHFIATCEELGERPLFVDARAGAEA